MLLRVAACSRCSGASHTIRRAEGVGDDQAGVGREDLARDVERGGEEQPVAMQPVVDPFLVGAKIGDRRLDLDDPDFAVAAERHQVGAPARRQRQFAHHRKAQRMQEPRGAARDRQRGRRLPAVDRQDGGQRAHAHGMNDPRQRHARGCRTKPKLTHATSPGDGKPQPIGGARAHRRSRLAGPGYCRGGAFGESPGSAPPGSAQ